MDMEIMGGKNMEQWQSAEINLLAEAIVTAQTQMQPAIKDSTNPFFKSKYADLSTVWAAVRPFLVNSIAITQLPMESGNHHIVLDTQLTHVSGQWMRSRITMPVSKDDPQGYGSALTYARRYALGCMTGLVTEEDDDGNHASQPMKPKYTICDAELRKRQEDGASRSSDGASLPHTAFATQQSSDASAPIIWNAGKPPHRGKDIREVDGSYLKWYEANGPQDEYRVKASQELDRRDLEQDANREMMP
jgi:hypothetical protein